MYLNVLEHIADDSIELARAAAALRPGGALLVFGPAHEWLYCDLDYKAGHYRRYSLQRLGAVVTAAGFEVVSLRYFDVVGVLPYWVFYGLLRHNDIPTATMWVYRPPGCADQPALAADHPEPTSRQERHSRGAEALMPAVSIVIPTRDRAHLLGRSLKAACAQLAVELEVIVVDDGPSDATRRVVEDAGDPRVRYMSNPAKRGVSAARNCGIAAAGGDWISFLDDDDVWSPEKLIRQLKAAEGAARHWAYAGDVNVDEGLRVLSGGRPPGPDAVLALLPRWNPLSSGCSNVVVRSEVLASVGGFDPGLRRTEDWDLWLRIARTGPPAWVCEPLVAYRFHAGNVATDPADMVGEARRLAVRHHIPVDMAGMHRRAAWTALRGGRRGLALRHYASAIARGDVRSLGRAAVALVHPAVGSDRLFDLLDRDPGWVAEAEHWLAAFVTPASAAPRELQ